METPVTSASSSQNSSTRPGFSGISHSSLPCLDIEQSKIFYSEVMGGELAHQIAGFVEYKIEDIIIGVSEQPDGWTGPDDEFPHYAFFVEAQDFTPMVSWLRQNGVTTSEPWTRDGIRGLLYFCDPSGNLFEIYCRN